MSRIFKKEFEDTKGVIIIQNVRKSEDNNTMAKGKRTKGQTTTYKTILRKLKIEQHETH
jgi:hypothetical protein